MRNHSEMMLLVSGAQQHRNHSNIDQKHKKKSCEHAKSLVSKTIKHIAFAQQSCMESDTNGAPKLFEHYFVRSVTAGLRKYVEHDNVFD